MTEDLTTPTPDAFEAALAANADDLAAPAELIVEEPVAEIAQEVSDQSVSDLALASDEDGDIDSD